MSDIDAATLKQWLSENGEVKLYDVRSQSEIQQGLIPGATWLPLHLIPLEVQRLTQEASAHRLVFYCQTGGRSAQASLFLARLGCGPVYNLRHGMVGWLSAGGELKAAPAYQGLQS